MLHEIFKGMDNAAELINENFQNGSIVEHNLNEVNPENGHYVKYGNGLMVCQGNFTKEFSFSESLRVPSGWGRTVSQTIKLPQEFINDEYTVSLDVTSSANPGDMVPLLSNPYTRDIDVFTYFVSVPTGTGITQESTVNWIAIGHWKE